jgi:tetraacyldisaccharide 4'-kinase
LLDRLYGRVALARRHWFERHPTRRRTLERPVISVGSLSVGGAGKTPVVAAVAGWLLARGERPAILSRGYRRARSADGVTVVSDGARILADVDQAGDEPLMLARQLPGAVVCVAADRYLAGVLAERRLGCTVHVLDDGFQHVRLARDLDVLVTTPGRIASGRVLPAGRLREPAEVAARAHLLIVVGGDAEVAAAEAWALGIGEYCGATRVIGGPQVLQVRQVRQEQKVQQVRQVPQVLQVRDGPVVAVAGIGDPAQFFEALEAAGWRVAGRMPFADHHRFTPADLAAIGRTLAATGAELVLTTEKDAVRFEALGSLPFALAQVPMSLTFDRWDTFEGALLAGLERGRERRARNQTWPPRWAATAFGPPRPPTRAEGRPPAEP